MIDLRTRLIVASPARAADTRRRAAFAAFASAPTSVALRERTTEEAIAVS
jgi:hypothetical protein